MFLRKLEKYLRWDLFCKSCGITDHSLLKAKFSTGFARNLPKVLIAALKAALQHCSSHDNMKQNLHFKQSRLNYIKIKEQKQKKKGPVIPEL